MKSTVVAAAGSALYVLAGVVGGGSLSACAIAATAPASQSSLAVSVIYTSAIPVEVAGYASNGGRDVTIYFLVDQLTTLRAVQLVWQNASEVRIQPQLSRTSGNAVSMAGYVFDTVQLSKPLGNRKVTGQDGSALAKMDPDDVGDPSAKVKRNWSPG